MADLNNILDSIQKKTSDVEKSVQDLLSGYNDLFREGTRMFNVERIASNGKMDGLEDFYRLIQIIRRNRDVVGSLTLGMKNIKSMDKFKFVEEDIPKIKKPKNLPKTGVSNGKDPEGPSPVINEQSVQDLKIPETPVATTEATNA